MGEMIREARKAKGISQTELAAMLGVTQATVCYWENGTNVPSVQTVKVLAEILEIPVDRLVNAV